MNFEACLYLVVSTVLSTSAAARSKKDPVLRQSFLKTAAYQNTVLETTQVYRDADLHCKRMHGLDYFYASTSNCESCAQECKYPFKNVTHTCMDKCEDYIRNKIVQEELTEAKESIQAFEGWKTEMEELLEAERRCFLITMVVVGIVAVIFAACIVGYVKRLRTHCDKTYAERPPPQHPEDDKVTDDDDRSVDRGYNSTQEISPLAKRV